jgi:glycosyltransferase involved in cell wall biosynthesis
VKILHHERKRLESHFSIERLFAEIRRNMPADCEVSSCPALEASAGILPRWRNIRHAAQQEADIHHIVGDSHYLAFGLPREKTVLTIHDCGTLNRLTGWKRALLKYFWFTGPMRRAAVVTTISKASKDELRKWVGPLADKVVVVPDCVFEEFAYDPKPFDGARPVVLQVGTKWNKNVERVMEAVRGTGCRLEIVGNLSDKQKASHGDFSHGWKKIDADRIRSAAPTGLRGECSCPGTPGARNASSDKQATEQGGHSRAKRDRQLEELSEATKLEKINTDLFRAGDCLGAISDPQVSGSGAKSLLPGNVGNPEARELGRLTDEELVAAYQRCDMVVFASLYEGFGLPILEAQATGRPVITSNFGAMREAAGDGALLVDPYSVDEIRAAILRIKNEPALREELVRKGRENVERFRAPVVAARYAELYRQIDASQ